MPPQDLNSIRVFLGSTTLKAWLKWFKQIRDERVSAALKPLLFEKKSKSVRVVSDRILRGELFALAKSSDAFRRFVAGKIAAAPDRITPAALDRITAEYLEEKIRGL